MKIHRFFGKFNFKEKTLDITDSDLIHQIIKVLRLDLGEKITLINEDSLEALTTITKKSPKSITVSLDKISKNQNIPKKEVSLYCAILKKENFELVVQKATEIGVTNIIPIITHRTIKTNLNHDRLLKITKEASEQSGRNTIPFLSKPISFEDAVLKSKQTGLNIIFHTNQNDSENKNIFDSQKINIFIGPEGGFDDSEIVLAQKEKFKIHSLGKLILRGETAAIIASYLAVN